MTLSFIILNFNEILQLDQLTYISHVNSVIKKIKIRLTSLTSINHAKQYYKTDFKLHLTSIGEFIFFI